MDILRGIVFTLMALLALADMISLIWMDEPKNKEEDIYDKYR